MRVTTLPQIHSHYPPSKHILDNNTQSNDADHGTAVISMSSTLPSPRLHATPTFNLLGQNGAHTLARPLHLSARKPRSPVRFVRLSKMPMSWATMRIWRVTFREPTIPADTTASMRQG